MQTQQTSHGYSQVANSQNVRDYMRRGGEIAKKIIEVLNLNRVPMITGATLSFALVMGTTISPFSDKLTMFHVSLMKQLSFSIYADRLQRLQDGTWVGLYANCDRSCSVWGRLCKYFDHEWLLVGAASTRHRSEGLC